MTHLRKVFSRPAQMSHQFRLQVARVEGDADDAVGVRVAPCVFGRVQIVPGPLLKPALVRGLSYAGSRDSSGRHRSLG